MFQTKVVQEISKHILRSLYFFVFRKSHVYEIMWKSVVDPDMRQAARRYGACAKYAGYLRLQTHTQNM